MCAPQAGRSSGRCTLGRTSGRRFHQHRSTGSEIRIRLLERGDGIPGGSRRSHIGRQQLTSRTTLRRLGSHPAARCTTTGPPGRCYLSCAIPGVVVGKTRATRWRHASLCSTASRLLVACLLIAAVLLGLAVLVAAVGVDAADLDLDAPDGGGLVPADSPGRALLVSAHARAGVLAVREGGQVGR